MEIACKILCKMHYTGYKFDKISRFSDDATFFIKHLISILRYYTYTIKNFLLLLKLFNANIVCFIRIIDFLYERLTMTHVKFSQLNFQEKEDCF